MVIKMMKKVTDRARKWKCVRFDDNDGFSTKFNKTNFPDQSRREMYYYSVKCVEKLSRGFSPTIVATKKRFQMFRKVSEGLKLKPLPEDFQSFNHMKKRETVEKLIDKFDNDLADAMTHGPVQGVDTQADYPDDMQVGEGSGPDPASEGVANSSRPPDVSQDVGFEGSYYLASDFGVKNIGTPMPPSEEDGLHRNRFISETLEAGSSLTGRPRKDVAVIPPEMYGGSAVGDLRSEPIMEVSPQGFIPQASDRQVSSGGENFVIMPNPGGSNTLQNLPIDTFNSAEPSADEPEQWAQWHPGQLDIPVDEGGDMQVNNPGQIQVDEVLAGALYPDLSSTLSNDTSLQDVAWNQCDNFQGQSPSRPPVPLEELVLIMNDLMHRASRFPGILPKFEWSEEAFRSFVIQLEFLEGAFEDLSRASLRSREEELYPPLEDFSGTSAYEAVTSMPSIENVFQDVGFQASDYPASDFGVNNIGTPMPPSEEDGLSRNRFISETLEAGSSLTGRLRKNVEDIIPAVDGGSADGDLRSEPIMEVCPQGFIPQASDRQVSNGGENFVIMPNPGGSNALQYLPIDPFDSLSADDRKWVEGCVHDPDIPVEEVEKLGPRLEEAYLAVGTAEEPITTQAMEVLFSGLKRTQGSNSCRSITVVNWC